MHLSDADAVLESVMVIRLGAGGVAEVVVPLCLAKDIYIQFMIQCSDLYPGTVICITVN